MNLGPVDALLFDLGNVVIRIDFERVFARWAAHAECDAAMLRETFAHDEPYQRHERGEIDTAAYFASLRNSLGVGLDDARFLDGWNAVFVEEMPGLSALLARIAPKIPVYAFTNTNRAHAAQCASAVCAGARSFPQGVRLPRDGATQTRAGGVRAHREGDWRTRPSAFCFSTTRSAMSKPPALADCRRCTSRRTRRWGKRLRRWSCES